MRSAPQQFQGREARTPGLKRPEAVSTGRPAQGQPKLIGQADVEKRRQLVQRLTEMAAHLRKLAATAGKS